MDSQLLDGIYILHSCGHHTTLHHDYIVNCPVSQYSAARQCILGQQFLNKKLKDPTGCLVMRLSVQAVRPGRLHLVAEPGIHRGNEDSHGNEN